MFFYLFLLLFLVLLFDLRERGGSLAGKASNTADKDMVLSKAVKSERSSMGVATVVVRKHSPLLLVCGSCCCQNIR